MSANQLSPATTCIAEGYVAVATIPEDATNRLVNRVSAVSLIRGEESAASSTFAAAAAGEGGPPSPASCPRAGLRPPLLASRPTAVHSTVVARAKRTPVSLDRERRAALPRLTQHNRHV